MAHNDENLHTLISTDLEYLIAWSYRWLAIVEVNAVVRHFRQPWVLIRKIWQ
jgi:hypothetical protein